MLIANEETSEEKIIGELWRLSAQQYVDTTLCCRCEQSQSNRLQQTISFQFSQPAQLKDGVHKQKAGQI